MYIWQIMQKSVEHNGITRICTNSGDILEGKFIDPNGSEGLLEFALRKGGTLYLRFEAIESITLLDNLQILEEKANE